jgi:signal transduction histidine kinase/CheY-like chemotaxis protein
MKELETGKYRQFVQDNLAKMIDIFAHISMDDFSKRIRLEDLKYDEFTEVFCGLDMMIDDLVEARAKYGRIRDKLENLVAARTAELSETNKKLIQDMAEREKAEAALFEREKFLSEVFLSIRDPISVLSTELTIVRVNDVMELWYAGKMPIAGKKCYWVYHNRDKPCENCPSLRTMATGSVTTEVVDKCDSQGNKVGWSEVNAFPWKDARTGKLLGVIEHVRDVTERYRLEEELFKVKKLESLGVLAGGIAHDFNNILTGIMSNIFLAKSRAGADPEAQRLLGDAEKASQRAGTLVRKLLTFSKGGEPVKEVIALNEVIEETIGFCLTGTSVDFTLLLAPGLRTIEADRAQIDQVFNNLFINAAQAMPHGGTLTVSSENIDVGPSQSRTFRLPASLGEGEYVRVVVSDEGEGIPSENMGKIFDPYFTTKDKGSGLGLTIAYSVVNRHKGALTVDSSVGRGTAVSVYLPASRAALPSLKKNENASPVVKSGRVLVLDDDTLVRTAIEKMLVYAGFEVSGTATGEETVALYEKTWKTGEPFSFVILDLTIPGGMGGKETVKKILCINSAAKVIVASGYSNDPVMADCRKYGFAGAVPKPFRMSELLEVLEKAAGDAA